MLHPDPLCQCVPSQQPHMKLGSRAGGPLPDLSAFLPTPCSKSQRDLKASLSYRVFNIYIFKNTASSERLLFFGFFLGGGGRKVYASPETSPIKRALALRASDCKSGSSRSLPVPTCWSLLLFLAGCPEGRKNPPPPPLPNPPPKAPRERLGNADDMTPSSIPQGQEGRGGNERGEGLVRC